MEHVRSRLRSGGAAPTRRSVERRPRGGAGVRGRPAPASIAHGRTAQICRQYPGDRVALVLALPLVNRLKWRADSGYLLEGEVNAADAAAG